MKALCVDDEIILLQALEYAVRQNPVIDEVFSFTSASKALECAKTQFFDIAFLDIHLHKTNGLELAKELKKTDPSLPVVFCTGYTEYALEAFDIPAFGYITKPVHPEDIKKQLDNLNQLTGGREKNKKLTVNCFGNFEVFANGRPLDFKRFKTKELLAYLIDRKGAAVSSAQLAAVLWDNEEDEKNQKNYLYQVLHHLKTVLAEAGFENVLIKTPTGYAVNTELLNCDYYDYLAGKRDENNITLREYMYQYSWAENTNAELQYKYNE